MVYSGQRSAPERAPFGLGRRGYLIERKGFDNLIRAMPAILTEYSDARLMILGEGPQHAVLEALIAELHLEQKLNCLEINPIMSRIG